MSCFTKKMVENPKFPVFTKRMRELKEEERGVNSMCEVMEKYTQEVRAEGRLDAIRNMIELGLTREQILKKYSEEEYEIAEKTLLVKS